VNLNVTSLGDTTVEVRNRITGRGIAVAPLLAFAFYLLPFMRILSPRTDEGTFLYGAERLLHGQVFARDFYEVMGPGTFYWLSLFYRWFGTTFLAARICLFISSVATGILMYVLSRPALKGYRPLGMVLIIATYFGQCWPGISHHTDSNCLTMLAVACLVAWLQKQRNVLMFIAGSIAALTTLVHQPKGFLVFLGIITWIVIVHRKHAGYKLSLVYLVLGYGVVLGAAAAFFALQAALNSLIDANLVWPLRHYGLANDVPYAYGLIKYYWRGGGASGPTAGVALGLACVLIIPFIYISVLPVLVLIQAFSRRARPVSPEILLFLVCGFAMWIAEFHRRDIVHLVFGAPLLVIASVRLLHDSRTRLARGVLLTLAIASCCLAVCNLILVLGAHSARTRVGSVAIFGSGAELAALDRFIPPGQELFVFPYCPSYYFLSRAVNPTRYSFLLTGYNPPDEFRDAVHILETHKTRYVLWDTDFKRKMLPLAFPGALRVPDDQLIVETYLNARYKTVYDAEGFRILERRYDQVLP
jgi:4-amino-4-deoxy-L-arabinose transferase-like glycosyltransferase